METTQYIKDLNDLHIQLQAFVGSMPKSESAMANINYATGSHKFLVNPSLETKSVDYTYGTDISEFLSDARTIWDRKLCKLLESNDIGEDAVQFFDTDHLSSVTKLGCNTFSNNAGLVKLSVEGVKTLTLLLESMPDNNKPVTKIHIVVPTYEMYERLLHIKSPFRQTGDGQKKECFIVYVPFFSNKKNWYVFNTSDCKGISGLHVCITKNLEFKIETVLTGDGIKSKISYEVEGETGLCHTSKVIRATDY
ncbi:MAG: hypothetical protein FMNOHCHN_03565 [Ignavibacteriaceae bacterium]|nr:hypothetical protein [Ignavibacteriaceae bacterium]